MARRTKRKARSSIPSQSSRNEQRSTLAPCDGPQLSGSEILLEWQSIRRLPPRCVLILRLARSTRACYAKHTVTKPWWNGWSSTKGNAIQVQ